MWGNEVDRRVIKPSSVVVDRPYACWDVTTANPISTHTLIFTLTWAHIHNIPSLLWPSSCHLYGGDLFLFTQTLTLCRLLLVQHWRESAYHIMSIVVFLCGSLDPRGFRGWRSRAEELARPSHVQQCGGFGTLIPLATFSHASSRAVIPD